MSIEISQLLNSSGFNHIYNTLKLSNHIASSTESKSKIFDQVIGWGKKIAGIGRHANKLNNAGFIFSLKHLNSATKLTSAVVSDIAIPLLTTYGICERENPNLVANLILLQTCLKITKTAVDRLNQVNTLKNGVYNIPATIEAIKNSTLSRKEKLSVALLIPSIFSLTGFAASMCASITSPTNIPYLSQIMSLSNLGHSTSIGLKWLESKFT